MVEVNYPSPKGSGFPPMANERILFMKEIKVINALDIDGKETPFSELTVEDQKQMAGKIRDTVMNFAGYRRKTA